MSPRALRYHPATSSEQYTSVSPCAYRSTSEDRSGSDTLSRYSVCTCQKRVKPQGYRTRKGWISKERLTLCPAAPSTAQTGAIPDAFLRLPNRREEEREHAHNANSTHASYVHKRGRTKTRVTPIRTQYMHNFLWMYIQDHELQRRFRAGSIPNRYNGRLQARSIWGALELAYASGVLHGRQSYERNPQSIRALNRTIPKRRRLRRRRTRQNPKRK